MLPGTNCAHLWNLGSQLVKREVITSILTEHKIIQLRKKGKKDTSQHQSVNIIVRVSVQKSYLEQRLHAAKEIKKQKNKAAKE